jgi:hypothetical protein
MVLKYTEEISFCDPQDCSKTYFYICLMFAFYVFMNFHFEFSKRNRVKAECEIYKDRMIKETKYTEKDIELFNNTMDEVKEKYKDHDILNGEIEKLNTEIRQSLKK